MPTSNDLLRYGKILTVVKIKVIIKLKKNNLKEVINKNKGENIMIWFIIAILLTIIMTVKEFKDWGFPDAVLTFFIYTLSSLLGAFLLNVGIGAIFSVYVTPVETHESTNLVALQDGDSIKGSFFLGSGGVNETRYYYYITETDLGLKENKVETNESYIQYTNNTPNIKTITKNYPNALYSLVGFPMWSNTYIIYIPEGSVTTDFNIDLK